MRHVPIRDASVPPRKRPWDERLMGRGIGFIDAHLLYSTLRRRGTRLWTHDKNVWSAWPSRFDVAHPRND